ncbi:MAG: 3-hydroxyacyl-ACP dehydratase FabZ [Syntrophobacterales bacterium]|nr:3-hydroxyacyl-ACP dehydratase FabZ [Syntrophobacterales bacterium]
MTKDVKWIQSVLPHRYPFLMVDRILFISAEEAVGVKNVTINEPYFQGHFPDDPIMPGVLLLEALAQLGGAMINFGHGEKEERRGYFAGLDGVRFRRPVRPGDQIILKVTLIKHKGNIYKLKGEATVDGETVVEGELLIALGK